MCGLKDCDRPGDMAPRIVFVLSLRGAHKTREVPSVLDLPVCAACRSKVTLDGTLVNTTQIGESLREAWLGSKLIDTKLEWIALTHPDYLKLKGLGPS